MSGQEAKWFPLLSKSSIWDKVYMIFATREAVPYASEFENKLFLLRNEGDSQRKLSLYLSHGEYNGSFLGESPLVRLGNKFIFGRAAVDIRLWAFTPTILYNLQRFLNEYIRFAMRFRTILYDFCMLCC